MNGSWCSARAFCILVHFLAVLLRIDNVKWVSSMYFGKTKPGQLIFRILFSGIDSCCYLFNLSRFLERYVYWTDQLWFWKVKCHAKWQGVLLGVAVVTAKRLLSLSACSKRGMWGHPSSFGAWRIFPDLVLRTDILITSDFHSIFV